MGNQRAVLGRPGQAPVTAGARVCIHLAMWEKTRPCLFNFPEQLTLCPLRLPYRLVLAHKNKGERDA